MSHSWRRQTGRRRLVVGVLVVLVLPAIAFQMGRRAETRAEAVANALPPEPTPITAAVEFRDLRATSVFHGSVVLETEILLSPADGVVISVAQGFGEALGEGDVLAVINDRPVFILEGDLPLVSDLIDGQSGSAVAQLQEALSRLGHLSAISGTLDAPTWAALAGYYADRGFEIVKNGGERSLSNAEFLFVPVLPTSLVAVMVERGDVVTAGDELAQHSPGPPRLFFPLAAGETAPAARSKVEVSVSGERIGGIVTAPSNASEIPGFFVEVEDLIPWEWVNQASQLEITDILAGPGLVVPITAIRFAGDGESYVTVFDDEVQTRVAVEVVAEWGGFVAVTTASGALTQGDRVIVGMDAG